MAVPCALQHQLWYGRQLQLRPVSAAAENQVGHATQRKANGNVAHHLDGRREINRQAKEARERESVTQQGAGRVVG